MLTNSTISSIPAPAPASERLYFLDWVRILAFLLLVLYHVGMYYVSWGWHIKSPHASDTIEPLMFLTNPWRMGMLFLISGVASSFMLKKQTAGKFLSSRCLRLLIPLIFGMALIVPPQAYLEVVEKAAYAGSYGDFLKLYFQAYQGFCADGSCLVLPTWNHLWFVAYLWTYSFLLWVLLRCAPRFIEKLSTLTSTYLRGYWIVIAPVAYMAIIRITLLSDHPPTNNLTNDWFNHASYLFLFLFGVVVGNNQAFWTQVAQVRWRSLAIALCGWLFMLWYTTYYSADRELPKAVLYFQRFVWVLLAWNAILALTGFARQHWNRDHAARVYLTEAVFPVYILHQTLIIVLAYQFRAWHLNPVVEGVILVILTLFVSLGAFEVVRRVRLLRPLFGLSWRAKADGSAYSKIDVQRA